MCMYDIICIYLQHSNHTTINREGAEVVISFSFWSTLIMLIYQVIEDGFTMLLAIFQQCHGWEHQKWASGEELNPGFGVMSKRFNHMAIPPPINKIKTYNRITWWHVFNKNTFHWVLAEKCKLFPNLKIGIHLACFTFFFINAPKKLHTHSFEKELKWSVMLCSRSFHSYIDVQACLCVTACTSPD